MFFLLLCSHGSPGELLCPASRYTITVFRLKKQPYCGQLEVHGKRREKIPCMDSVLDFLVWLLFGPTPKWLSEVYLIADLKINCLCRKQIIFC